MNTFYAGHLKRGKPSIVWTTGSYSDVAAQIGPLMAETGKYFSRGGGVCELQQQDDAPTIRMLRPAEMCSRFESVAMLTNSSGEVTRANEQQAKLIMCAETFRDALPTLNLISPCPVLIEQGGKLETVTGFDRSTGIWAAGEAPQGMSIEEAQRLLYDLLADFLFVSDGDRARAFAALITPALVFSGLLQGRAPLFTNEADDSQAGKGFFNKLVAAIYGQRVMTISQRKSGVGSIEEALSRALISGVGFIALDNLRGKIDLPSLESLLTEDVYLCRVPYQGDIPIDPRKYNFSATSNKAEYTRDLANRSCITRLKKQPACYQFKNYPNGNILDEIRANQCRYLGVIYSVVKTWHAAGKPKSAQAGHDFRAWAATLDWICQNLLSAGPLMVGHEQAKQRTANTALSWLRDVALLFTKSGNGDWLRAHEILDAVLDAGAEVPGLMPGDNPEDEQTRKRLLQAIGRRLGQAFKSDAIELDGIKCERSTEYDSTSRNTMKLYRFTPCVYSASKSATKETLAASNASNTTQHLNRVNKYKDMGEIAAPLESYEPLDAIAADQPHSRRQYAPIVCQGCEKMTAEGHCRRYAKLAVDVMHCLKKEQTAA